MIFAHGPAGFVSAFMAQRLVPRMQQFTDRQRLWLLIIGGIGGIFPDVDLFYYYLVSAEETHRGFITHTPFLYITCAVVFGFILWRMKKHYASMAVCTFSIGAISHTIFDAIGAQIKFLYPFSNNFFGLSDLGNPVINSNLFFVNFLVEGLCFFFFFYVLIWMFTKTVHQRLIATLILVGVFAAGVGTLTFTNAHMYHGEQVLPWHDDDGDGIMNANDRDIDGDGVLNIDDLDADNDGKSNVEEIAVNSEGFLSLWYDPTNGGFIQIPARLGLVTNDDVARRLYQTAGIFLETEMQEDYAQNQDGYVVPPSDADFDRTPENILAWLRHMDRVEEGKALTQGRNQIGDILFYETGHVAIVVGFTTDGHERLLDVHMHRPIKERSVEELRSDEGEIVARGKMLDAAALYRGQDSSE